MAIGLGVLLSASGLLIEEMSFHIYPKGKQMLALGAAVLLAGHLPGPRRVAAIVSGCGRPRGGAEPAPASKPVHVHGPRHPGAAGRLLPLLERDFGAWRRFDGLALHELRDAP